VIVAPRCPLRLRTGVHAPVIIISAGILITRWARSTTGLGFSPINFIPVTGHAENSPIFSVLVLVERGETRLENVPQPTAVPHLGNAIYASLRYSAFSPLVLSSPSPVDFISLITTRTSLARRKACSAQPRRSALARDVRRDISPSHARPLFAPPRVKGNQCRGECRERTITGSGRRGREGGRGRGATARYINDMGFQRRQ